MADEYQEEWKEVGSYMQTERYKFLTGERNYEYTVSKTYYALSPKKVANEGIFSILSWHNFVTFATKGQIVDEP